MMDLSLAMLVYPFVNSFLRILQVVFRRCSVADAPSLSIAPRWWSASLDTPRSLKNDVDDFELLLHKSKLYTLIYFDNMFYNVIHIYIYIYVYTAYIYIYVYIYVCVCVLCLPLFTFLGLLWNILKSWSLIASQSL